MTRIRSRRALPWMIVALLIGCGDGSGSPETIDRPNIVLIVSDDQGWSDYGFMGSEIARTPSIDALAAEGFRFSLAFNTGNICRPSLRSILTGYHPAQFDARISARPTDSTRSGGRGIRQIETLPRLLASRGYVSFQGGKYWEGDHRDAGFTDGLSTGGRRAGRGTTAGALEEDATAELGRFLDNPLFRVAGGESLELGRSTMSPLLDFIDAHRKEPFFVWFAPLLPHTPFDASSEDREPFAAAGLSENAIGYYANITRLDRRVGELLAHLEERGLTERTIVVFLSDNGWEVGRPNDPQERMMGGSRGKSSIHERGFRTPLLVRWPDRIQPTIDEHHLVSTVDLFTTLLEFAGVEAPSDRWGQSFAGLVTGSGSFERDRVMAEVKRLRKPPGARPPYVMDQHALFLRTLDWRFVRIEDHDANALYSMLDDPEETTNVCDANPRRCLRMQRELERWREAMSASPPIPPGEAP